MSDNREARNMEEENLSLVDSWSETIANSNLGDLLIDLSEVGLDAVTENEFIKDIPIISTVVSLYKIGHSLRERSYIKKLEAFLREISKGTVDEKKREQYLDRITKDKRTVQHELEYVLLLVDRIISEQKAQFLARLLVAYITTDIDWRMFCQLSEVIDRFLPGDAECLHRSILQDSSRSDVENCALQRLQSLGLVTPNAKASVFDIKGNAISTVQDGTYELTFLGRVLKGIIL